MKHFIISAEKLIELAETEIPEQTLHLVRDVPGEDAARIGWVNAWFTFKAALEEK